MENRTYYYILLIGFSVISMLFLVRFSFYYLKKQVIKFRVGALHTLGTYEHMLIYVISALEFFGLFFILLSL